MIIKNGLVFSPEGTFENKTILTQGNKIKSVGIPSDMSPKDDNMVLDANGCYVIPGLIDIHFHACMGHDFCDSTFDAIEAMATYELDNGITSICPATMTLDSKTIASICKTAGEYKKYEAQFKGADLCGINLEGPFVSLAKKGAQNPDYIIPASLELIKELAELSGGLTKLTTLAPETKGGIQFIEQAKDIITVSLGHTAANYETAKMAFDAGARHVTHLYNAMQPFNHRDSGVIGAAFDTPGCFVELICDGIHISPAVIRATFQLFGKDRVVLISDSMMATGLEDGQYSLGGQAVTVRGNLATLKDGTIAGSVTNLMECLRHTVSVGIPLEAAVIASTKNPAQAIHVYDQTGSIENGKHANLLVLDKHLNIKHIIFKGNMYR